MKFLLILDTVKRLNQKCNQAEQEGSFQESLNDGFHIVQRLFSGVHICEKT